MQALHEEIERLEAETAEVVEEATVEESTEEVSVEEEAAVEEVTEEADTEEAAEVEETEEAEVEAEPETSEDEAKKAQEAYRERQKAKKEEAARKAEEDRARAEREALIAEQQANNTVDEAALLKYKLDQVDQILFENQQQKLRVSAERELASLESEFKVAFTDYDDKVNEALEFAKLTHIADGMSESDAIAKVKLDKLMIANAAAKRGDDPVEAVYKEAKAIKSKFDSIASQLGYVKAGAKKDVKTQKAALREASKPNASSAGGRGASAVKYSYDDLDDVSDIPFGDMLKGIF